MSSIAGAFALLHSEVQEQLYDMRWTELRPIQVESIHSILESHNHLIISASTASGKTEAAFLPILSKLVDNSHGGVRSLYLGPLKALINDQFQRLELLCKSCRIPVQGWHGDVPQSQKKRLLKQPAGILLITPESLESLFINRQTALKRLFTRLEFVVIDELHSFIGTERGMHARSLTSRLQQLVNHRIRLIGLSATLGNLNDGRRWIDAKSPQAVDVIEGAKGEKAIHYQIRGYVSPLTLEIERDRNGEQEADEVVDSGLVNDIFETYYGKTALIFGNSKRRIELCADLVRQQCARQKLPDRFSVHHGSLSKEERELTEAWLKSDIPTATFCSSSLELGIDVGNVQEVGHLDSPSSVSSLAQRLGRSGRGEGEPSIMRVYIEVLKQKPDAPLTARIYPDLLQAIALTELMLEHWCEPPDSRSVHLGPLVQQILSVIKEKGGYSAPNIYNSLVTRGPFSHITPRDFVEVLRALGEADLIESAPEGYLILGLTGEKLTSSLEFYAVFSTPDEYSVHHGPHTIGRLSMYPGDGSDGFLILAGRRWRITNVDDENKEIWVEPARAGTPPIFAGATPGPTHPRIHQKMKSVLLGTHVPAYLDSNAKVLLSQARAAAKPANLDRFPLIRFGQKTIWFLWSGTCISRTLCAICRRLQGKSIQNDEFAITFDGFSPNSLADFLRNIPWTRVNDLDLLKGCHGLKMGKFDSYLSQALRDRAAAKELFDLPGAERAVENLLASYKFNRPQTNS